MHPTQVILRPVVSEKTYQLAAADKYTFRVHKRAHKTQIRQAQCPRSWLKCRSKYSITLEVQFVSCKLKHKSAYIL